VSINNKTEIVLYLGMLSPSIHGLSSVFGGHKSAMHRKAVPQIHFIRNFSIIFHFCYFFNKMKIEHSMPVELGCKTLFC
jgi:hypothetical protein